MTQNNSNSPGAPVDPAARTQPVYRADRSTATRPISLRKRRNLTAPILLGVGLLIAIIVLPYVFTPARYNILVLGIDRAPDDSAMSRSDTMIMMSVNPFKPEIKSLSIPRDLWVSIPGVGENRINAAHFFAELNQPGSGPEAATAVVKANFGVDFPYYIRLRFDSFEQIVTAMGGITLELDEPTAGYPAGENILDAAQALAFVRDRQGADDFFRMANGQLFVKSAVRQMLAPRGWARLPGVLFAVNQSLDTNIPSWLWLRLGLAFLRAGAGGTDARVLPREMTTPFRTSEGADVLLPQWEPIHALVDEMFP
jgi:LCP family protein required for cell wall assembly